MKYFEMKEITCDLCNGLGIYVSECECVPVLDENNCYRYEGIDGTIYETDYTCPKCRGNGYIQTEPKNEEGLAVYSENMLQYLEHPYVTSGDDRKISNLTVTDIGCMIAEYYDIIDYKNYIEYDRKITKTHVGRTYIFATELHNYEYCIKLAENVTGDDKLLIPKAIMVDNNVCHLVLKSVYQKTRR